MSISYLEKERIFTIQTASSTYQMQVDRFGFLLHLYYGTKTNGSMSYLLTYYDRGFSGNPYCAGDDRTYSLDALPQEFPVVGQGDFRSPALVVKTADGVYGCDLRYVSYRITEGKYGLPGLPAVYDTEKDVQEGAQTLEILLEDCQLGLRVRLLYGVLPDIDIVTRAAIIENNGENPVWLERACTASLDFVSGSYDWMTFYGRHAMERNVQRAKIGHGVQRIGSERGMSSHQYNPMAVMLDPETGERSGRCWAMQFVYSGGFAAVAERDQYEQTRLQMGLPVEQFSYPLHPGDQFVLPEVILSFSDEGLSRLSRNLHDCIREHVCRGKYKMHARPVVLNSWEAAYFDLSGDTILGLAREAKDLGIDMIVMDDGWFGNRFDDRRSLGDWSVNETKLGCSLQELITRVNEMGLQFGIWMEPEMISEDSDLYRAHPDWAMVVPGRAPVRARFQLVLDFSRREVTEEIYRRICSVLDQGNIEYLKWDYNRGITDVYSHGTGEQGRVLYDYMLGLYDVLERLHRRYPNLLIEGCAGGGGRFDAGMLYYAPQIWCSDNSDAVNRAFIQYGTSFGYPACTMGAHVSVCPNEQNGRMTPFETRGAVAMGGALGYELDPAALKEEERTMVVSQIRDYHRYEHLLHEGDYYRLSDPYVDGVCAWELAAKDASEVLMNVVKLELTANAPTVYVRLRALTPGAFYRDTRNGRCYPAGALMDTGLPLPNEPGEYRAYTFHLERTGNYGGENADI